MIRTRSIFRAGPRVSARSASPSGHHDTGVGRVPACSRRKTPGLLTGGVAYRKNLESRFPTPESLERYLGSVLALTPEPILCCFEADASQCHRRILAGYLKEMLGLDVPEWKETSLEQGSLL